MVTKENYDMLIQQIDKIFTSVSKDKLTSRYFNVENILKFKNAEELIKYYFEPESNGFKCLNYNELQEELQDKKARELWTDSKCLLVENNLYHEII